MTRASSYLPMALANLFLAFVVLSNAQNAGAGEDEARVSVAAGAPLELECRLRPEQRAEWRLDGEEPPADLQPAPEAPAPDGRLTARLRAPAARPRHAGLYTCSAEGRRGPRVRLSVLPAPAPPAAPAAAPSAPGEAGAGAGAEADAAAAELLFDVRSNITLNCTLPNESKQPYVWTKNDTNVEELSDLKGRYALESGGATFVVAHSAEDDFGNYTCELGGAGAAGGAEQRWTLRGRTFAKLPADSNVVEGQKLKLQCKVVGKPYPRVVWTFSNSSEEDAAGVEVRAALGERVTLRRSEQGAEDGELVVEAVRRADAGRYACAAPRAGAPPHAAATTLHVKDMYAALWPFLGICAEVFVLCAIILVYEKRRTKPELDDSDTDNHDQKKS